MQPRFYKNCGFNTINLRINSLASQKPPNCLCKAQDIGRIWHFCPLVGGARGFKVVLEWFQGVAVWFQVGCSVVAVWLQGVVGVNQGRFSQTRDNMPWLAEKDC